MVKLELEVDAVDGQKALLYLRDAQGVDWIAAALLSPLRSPESDAERTIDSGEQMHLVAFTLVIP
jgi:hypothetical protein